LSAPHHARLGAIGLLRGGRLALHLPPATTLQRRHVDDDGGEVNGSQEVSGKFVVASCDARETLSRQKQRSRGNKNPA